MQAKLFTIKPYKLGIALSGGGARGFGHLGVLKALHEREIFPEIISGTSAGAIVGAFYADGKSPDEIVDIFFSNSIYKYLSIIFPRTGLMRITGLKEVLIRNLHAKTFEELKIPLIVTATELESGNVARFASGKLVRPILASSSIPVIFTPTRIDGKTYVDGAVLESLPIEPLTPLCKRVIGVNVNPAGEESNFSSLFKIAERSFHLAMVSRVRKKKERCWLFIEPMELATYSIFDVKKGKEMFDIGYKEAIKALNNKQFLKSQFK